MRKAMALLAGWVCVCAMMQGEPPRSAEAQAKYDKIMDRRVPGETRTCVTNSHLNGPVGIDDNVLLFRDGPRVLRNDLQGSNQCRELGPQSSFTTESTANQLCAGDKIVFDSGNITGACVLGKFTTYSRPKK